MVLSTCAKANTPIKMGIIARPPLRKELPKVKRYVPVKLSTPTVANSKPRIPPIRPLITDFPDTLVMMLMPKKASAKYSGDLKFRATLARYVAPNTSTTQLNSPPHRDEKVDIPSARPGCRICTDMG